MLSALASVVRLLIRYPDYEVRNSAVFGRVQISFFWEGGPKGFTAKGGSILNSKSKWYPFIVCQ